LTFLYELPDVSPYEDISDYIPLLQDSIGEYLERQSLWPQTDYPQALSYLEDLRRWLIDLPVANIPMAYPTFAMHFHHNSYVVRGNPLSQIVNASCLFNSLVRQDASALHDRFSFSVLLAAGNYDMTICYHKRNVNGIMSMACPNPDDDFELDGYAGTTTLNQFVTQSVQIDADGNHEFVASIELKAAVAQGYDMNITYFEFKPSSA